MQVIIRKKIEKLGDIGDIINVKDGYARNYLLPRGYVVKATPGNIKEVELIKSQIKKRNDKKINNQKELAKKISQLKINIPVKVGEDNQIFGSVTSANISEYLIEKGFEVNKKSIKLDDPIKSLGIHNVILKLDDGIESTLKVYVIKEI
tara:strand:+ start:3107 stop:3553 length:447 start_codon:yes stop_codon:yes gene_type:complete